MLKHAARERGIVLAEDVPGYLLTHFRRDMPSLMALLDELDRFSLEQKRAVTRPLLRTMLQHSGRAAPFAPSDGRTPRPPTCSAICPLRLRPAAPDNDPTRFK